MKKDGRTHDRKTKEAIRVMAVERILEGEDVAEHRRKPLPFGRGCCQLA